MICWEMNNGMKFENVFEKVEIKYSSVVSFKLKLLFRSFNLCQTVVAKLTSFLR